jgi:hypothetical protein
MLVNNSQPRGPMLVRINIPLLETGPAYRDMRHLLERRGVFVGAQARPASGITRGGKLHKERSRTFVDAAARALGLPSHLYERSLHLLLNAVRSCAPYTGGRDRCDLDLKNATVQHCSLQPRRRRKAHGLFSLPLAVLNQ